jgi:hypothetical protein
MDIEATVEAAFPVLMPAIIPVAALFDHPQMHAWHVPQSDLLSLDPALFQTRRQDSKRCGYTVSSATLSRQTIPFLGHSEFFNPGDVRGELRVRLLQPSGKITPQATATYTSKHCRGLNLATANPTSGTPINPLPPMPIMSPMATTMAAKR